MNFVIGGDYKNSLVGFTFSGKVYISYSKQFAKTEKIFLNRDTVAEYMIVDQNEKAKMGSGLVRSVVGGTVFGVAGALAGAASAKKKKSYIIEILFKDGKRSTIEIDKNVFKFLLGCL